MTPIEWVLVAIAAACLYWIVVGVVVTYRVVVKGEPVPPLFEEEEPRRYEAPPQRSMPWGDEYD